MVRVFASAEVAMVHSFNSTFHFGFPSGKLKASRKVIHGFDLIMAVVHPICVTKLVTEEKDHGADCKTHCRRHLYRPRASQGVQYPEIAGFLLRRAGL